MAVLAPRMILLALLAAILTSAAAPRNPRQAGSLRRSSFTGRSRPVARQNTRPLPRARSMSLGRQRERLTRALNVEKKRLAFAAAAILAAGGGAGSGAFFAGALQNIDSMGFAAGGLLTNQTERMGAIIPGDSALEVVATSGIYNFLNYYNFAIVARLLLTWFPNPPQALVGPLSAICDPYLNLFRGIIPPLGQLDLSPIISLGLLSFITGATAALPCELKKRREDSAGESDIGLQEMDELPLNTARPLVDPSTVYMGL